jgi:hypothetical protein
MLSNGRERRVVCEEASTNGELSVSGASVIKLGNLSGAF